MTLATVANILAGNGSDPCHNKGGEINFFDGHVAYFKTSYIQHNPSSGGEGEPLLPEVIWDPPYRPNN